MILKESGLNLKKTGLKQMSWVNIYRHYLIVQLLQGKGSHILSGESMTRPMKLLELVSIAIKM